MADAMKCPVRVVHSPRIGYDSEILDADGFTLAESRPSVAPEIARKLNAHEAMARYLMAVSDFSGEMTADEWTAKYAPDGRRDRITIMHEMHRAALAAAKGGENV